MREKSGNEIKFSFKILDIHCDTNITYIKTDRTINELRHKTMNDLQCKSNFDIKHTIESKSQVNLTKPSIEK